MPLLFLMLIGGSMSELAFRKIPRFFQAMPDKE
jgi:hypothetical protein